MTFWQAQSEGESRSFEEWYWDKLLGAGKANLAIKFTRELGAKIFTPEGLESKPVKLELKGNAIVITYLNGQIWELNTGCEPRCIFPADDTDTSTTEDEDEIDIARLMYG